jgi:hypothetical protein
MSLDSANIPGANRRTRSVPPRDGGPVLRHLTTGEAITDGERVLEYGLDVARRNGPRMHLGDLAAAADPMCEAGLMAGLIKLSIRAPAVADGWAA